MTGDDAPTATASRTSSCKADFDVVDSVSVPRRNSMDSRVYSDEVFNRIESDVIN